MSDAKFTLSMIFFVLCLVFGLMLGTVIGRAHGTDYERRKIEGIDCIVAHKSPAISCDWPALP